MVHEKETLLRIVVVALDWYETVRFAAVDDEMVMRLESKYALPARERCEFGVVVPIPNSPALVSVVRVEVEVLRSLIVPHARSPAGVVEANQCLRSAPRLGLERTN